MIVIELYADFFSDTDQLIDNELNIDVIESAGFAYSAQNEHRFRPKLNTHSAAK